MTTNRVPKLRHDEMAAAGVKPELEIFKPGMVHFWNHLVAEGKAPDAAIANLLLRVLGASPGSAKSLVDIVCALPSDLVWAVAGIGHYQKPTVALGAAMGGHVRVGMEGDPRGERDGWTNMDSVKRAVVIADGIGRPVASALQATETLGLEEPSHTSMSSSTWPENGFFRGPSGVGGSPLIRFKDVQENPCAVGTSAREHSAFFRVTIQVGVLRNSRG